MGPPRVVSKASPLCFFKTEQSEDALLTTDRRETAEFEK